MSNTLFRMIAAATLVVASSPAFAVVGVSGNLDYTTSLDTVTSSSISTVDMGTSTTTGLVSSSTMNYTSSGGSNVQISFTGSAGVYNGNVSGVVAAPVVNGAVTTGNFLAAEPSGNVTMTFASQQTYFGLDWGSVDTYNTLSFYNGNTLVGSLTGTQILNNTNGTFGASSANVSVNVGNGQSFNRVVASSTSPAFEFGMIQSAVKNVPLPAPLPPGAATPLGALAALLMFFQLFRLRGRNADLA